jgi:formylglycine-generating enzyme required for sulfatase activity
VIHDRQEHDLGKIRTLLTKAFTAKDLRRFCQDRPLFRPICGRFGAALKLNDMVDEVIDYCETRDLFDELLAGVKQVNPRQFARYGYEIDGSPMRDEEERLRRVGKARALLQQDRLDEAIQVLRTARKAHPADEDVERLYLDALYRMAIRLWLWDHDLPKAKLALEDLLRIDPSHGQAAKLLRDMRGSVRPVQEPISTGSRPGVERELGLETVPVPAGPFLMGSDRRKDQHETPQHVCVLPTFQIGRYPVTNRQYSAFIEATGREPPAVWYQGRFDPELADHPVVSVSWHEAQAYVAWLREQTGRPYRLPTEAEWEKAARGDDGRLWPWGTIWDPARVNCKQAGPGETTPVGEYSPQGDSPYGCADMAGNVLEWTQTLWGRDWERPDFVYPYDPGDGREALDVTRRVFRVLRGGSCFSHAVFVRCTCRYWDWADSRDAYVGFRVAMDST